MQPYLNPFGKQLYVLRRIDDGFIHNARATSNVLDGPPNVSDPNLQYLPIYIDDTPANDPVYTLVDQVEGADNPVNASATQWQIKFNVKDRPLAERLVIADNTERFEVQKHIAPQDLAKMTVLTLAAVFRQAKGLILEPDEQSSADALVLLAAKLRANADLAADNRAAITAGQKPDLKVGWQVVS